MTNLISMIFYVTKAGIKSYISDKQALFVMKSVRAIWKIRRKRRAKEEEEYKRNTNIISSPFFCCNALH